MVKQGNKRVMITFTQKTQQKADKLLKVYDMTLSQLLKMLIDEKCQERKID